MKIKKIMKIKETDSNESFSKKLSMAVQEKFGKNRFVNKTAATKRPKSSKGI